MLFCGSGRLRVLLLDVAVLTCQDEARQHKQSVTKQLRNRALPSPIDQCVASEKRAQIGNHNIPKLEKYGRGHDEKDVGSLTDKVHGLKDPTRPTVLFRALRKA